LRWFFGKMETMIILTKIMKKYFLASLFVIVIISITLLVVINLFDRKEEIGVKSEEKNIYRKENWTTYESEEYGFEISYPKAWGDCEITEREDISGNAQKIITLYDGIATEDPENPKADENYDGSFSYPDMDINIYNCKNPKNFSIKEFFETLNTEDGLAYSEIDNVGFGYLTLASKDKDEIILESKRSHDQIHLNFFEVNGQITARVPWIGYPTGGIPAERVYFLKENNFYRINYGGEFFCGTGESVDKWKETFREIVSTFRFLE
jgi:competence protein ComGC